ncbi:hypothetical protein A2Z33_02255 [Candidatus Gottesmanbacteria bacterium RBG_16_52_11]|uniref:Uncharacterized protein n=1 Tax=Candidatus Gottesmanbacteria bacterium RBG_16_52_11 TaxID=1798374 RepID=A0A1F5YRH9_9BACT|nr:MAG: hypothetical protein A2Z33_02255 [Candidatus Gottesmanbacteria bacterium RBG_16_52_11]
MTLPEYQEITVTPGEERGWHWLVLSGPDGVTGKLSCLFNPATGGYSHLEIEVSPRGIGLGSLLMQRFAADIGPGKPVDGVITNNEAKVYLAEAGYFSMADRDGPVTLTDPGELGAIPAVRAMSACGIFITELSVRQHVVGAGDIRYLVSFTGVTTEPEKSE